MKNFLVVFSIVFVCVGSVAHSKKNDANRNTVPFKYKCSLEVSTEKETAEGTVTGNEILSLNLGNYRYSIHSSISGRSIIISWFVTTSEGGVYNQHSLQVRHPQTDIRLESGDDMPGGGPFNSLVCHHIS